MEGALRDHPLGTFPTVLLGLSALREHCGLTVLHHAVNLAFRVATLKGSGAFQKWGLWESVGHWDYASS